MVQSRCAERVHTAFARYEEAVERQRVEEVQWHVVDRRCTELVELFRETIDALKSSTLIAELK